MRSTPARVLAVIHAQKFKDDQAKCIGRQRLESWKFDQEVIQLGHIEVAMDDMDSAVAEDLGMFTSKFADLADHYSVRHGLARPPTAPPSALLHHHHEEAPV